MSHHTGVQFTTFPSHTIELTNQTREESPVQKINRHVPAFQLEASVRCQVRGTEAEVKAKREKMVNTWLAAGIFQCLRGSKRPVNWRLYALLVVRIASCTVPVFRYGGGGAEIAIQEAEVGLIQAQYLRCGRGKGGRESFLRLYSGVCEMEGEKQKSKRQAGVKRARTSVYPLASLLL